jgi:hypothetical protein
MKKQYLLIALPVIFLLGGCQNMMKTMFTHIRIDNFETAAIAKANAATNFCLSKSMLDRKNAYEFSTVAAEFLELVVFDNEFYKTTYERNVSMFDGFNKNDPAGSAPACQQLETELPAMTAKLLSNYRSYAQQLGAARSEESRRLAESLSNFRLPNTPAPQMNFPSIGYSKEPSPSQHFLVNTKDGLTQCKVTKSNFVFCL